MNSPETKDPRKHLMENYGAAMLDTTREFSPDDYQRTAKRFAKVYGPHLNLAKNARVLDVGCGDGQFLYYLRSQGVSALAGIDSSGDRLERCKRYVTPNVQTADAFEWLKSHPAQYDLVVCNHMVEHFEDEQLFELMEGLTGAVAPGGQLLITTPNACTPWSGYNHYSDLTHVRLFTTDSLTQLLATYGFKADCFPEAAVPYDLGTTLRWMLWKVREAWLKFDFRIQVGGTRGRQKTAFLVSPNLFALAKKV
jgi:2-polyprenyl-3-methyl-5-hydroxy-6-metoxy-1,4-benzoquinol methylase